MVARPCPGRGLQRGVAAISQIAFVSSLPEEHYHQLEALLFFNGRQHRVRKGIETAIDRYGAPEIVTTGKQLRVRVGETLDSIAEGLFNDARISYVIYEINKEKLPATITDGAITRDLVPGTVLYLPTASEIRRFLAFYSNARAS